MNLLGALIIGAAITYLIYQQYIYCTTREKRKENDTYK